MRWRFWVGLVLLWPLLLQADEGADGRRLASSMLALAGTSAVFDSTAVQKALLDPMPWISRPERLVALSGLRAWQSPRVLLLREEEGRWVNMAGLPEVRNAANRRGMILSPKDPSPEFAPLLGTLTSSGNASIPGLLAAHEADVLVLATNSRWRLWSALAFREGVIPGAGADTSPAMLPVALAESLAADQQWPEAAGRAVLRVENVQDLKAVLAVQGALQGLAGVRQVQLIRVQRGEAWFTAQGKGTGFWAGALGAEPRIPIVSPLPGIEPLLREAGALTSPLVFCRWEPDVMALSLPVQPLPPVQSPL